MRLAILAAVFGLLLCAVGGILTVRLAGQAGSTRMPTLAQMAVAPPPVVATDQPSPSPSPQVTPTPTPTPTPTHGPGWCRWWPTPPPWWNPSPNPCPPSCRG
jgi:hypothetical protein